MNQDKREKIKAVVQEWVATVLSQWHKRELSIDEVVNKIVTVTEYPQIMIEEWKRAYAAGVIDGEGSVQIVKSKAPSCAQGYRYELLVSVSSTSPAFCRWLKDNFRGSFYQSGKTSVGNLVYHWQIEAKGALAFLELIYPYLIIKKAKTDIALEFQRARTKAKGKKRKYAQADWDLQEAQKCLIQKTK